jgi:hypothetical protein
MSSYNPHPQQLDITLSGQDFLSIPEHMPGRLNTDDFVYFEYSNLRDPNNYTVVISSNDTSGSQFRSIGPLRKFVKLPFVQLDAYGVIGLVPNNDHTKPQFWGRLNRASTYVVPSVGGKPGKYALERHGVLTAAVSDSHLLDSYRQGSYTKLSNY